MFKDFFLAVILQRRDHSLRRALKQGPWGQEHSSEMQTALTPSSKHTDSDDLTEQRTRLGQGCDAQLCAVRHKLHAVEQETEH